MRILLVSQNFGAGVAGGAEAVAMRTARYLAERHRLRVLSLERPHIGPDGDEGLAVTRLAYRNLYRPEIGKSGAPAADPGALASSQRSGRRRPGRARTGRERFCS